MKKKKPQSFVAAFVYYAESDDATLPTNASIPLLLELMNELEIDNMNPDDLVMQVVEDALVVGTEDGQRAGVILVHTVQKPETKS